MLVVHGLHRRGFEFKRTTSPDVTRSLCIALEDLRLDGIDVIHAGRHSFPLGDRIRAIPLSRIVEDLEPLV